MGCEPVINAGDVERMLTRQGPDTLVCLESLQTYTTVGAVSEQCVPLLQHLCW